MAEETMDMSGLLEDAVNALSEQQPNEEQKAELAGDPKGGGEKKAEPADEPPADPEPFVPDDALVERAVKAGLSMSDAKAFPNAEMAERILTALEAKAEGGGKKADGKDGEEAAGVPDLDISEFTEENGYDPAMVKLVQSMKSVIEAQAKEISSIKKAGESAKEKDFFTQQFNGLDERVRSHMDAARKSQLKSKFGVLEAGYKAAGSKISREDIFKEAVQLAAGDLVSAAEAESKSAAAQKRKTLAIARPGGNFGAKGDGAPMSEADIADALFTALTK